MMQVLDQEFLSWKEVHELSPALLATALALGLSLWVFGWRAHRFWVVLGATLVGGIAGLMYTSKTPGIPTLVVGLLAAIAAGMLALALVRVVAFVAGGLLVYTAVLHTPLSWEYSLVAGLVGGLLGVFLFRFWTMVLTSMVGTLLSGYAAVLLLDRANVLDAASFAKQYPVLANWLWGLLSLLGLLIQFVLERRRIHKKRLGEEKAQKKAREAAKQTAPQQTPPPKRTWWSLGRGKDFRQAG